MRRIIARRLSSASSLRESHPSSVFSIPTKGSDTVGESGAAIRDVGCSRRVFLLKPHLTSVELDGLAYRIKVLSRNKALNSIFIATSEDDDAETDALPTSILELEPKDEFLIDTGDFMKRPYNSIFHVSGGYDPKLVYETGMHEDPASLQELLNGVMDLAKAIHGKPRVTQIPVVTMPHGLVNDAGYAFCMGSYVLATPDTSFSLLNPSRGLSFDPLGFSFFLPRLGWEFNQTSAEYPGCGMILALTGMEANASDMIETGLATHYIDSVSTLGMLERSLGELPPWDHHTVQRKPPRYYGQPESKEDINASVRNVPLANLLYSFSAYTITSVDIFSKPNNGFTPNEDPSLELDPVPLYRSRSSDIVNYGATFDPIFQEEKSVEGILERFRQVATRETMDEEEQAATEVAKDIVKRMEKLSPMALSVIYRLMQMGSQTGETLEGCMEREAKVQAKLFAYDDFGQWAKHTTSGNESTFTDWKHSSLAAVSSDEVDEILS